MNDMVGQGPMTDGRGRRAGELTTLIAGTRRFKRMTQQQLADISGIKQPEIAKIETGKISPTWDTVSRLLDALDVRLTVKAYDWDKNGFSDVVIKEIVAVEFAQRERREAEGRR